jgi:ABC-2 type transport system permease protein
VSAEIALEALRERRRSIVWWGIGLTALVLLNVVFYPSIRDDPALSDYVENLPESVRGLFVGGELDITSPTGFLNSQVFALTAPVVLLIFSIGGGAAAVAGEEERGTLDLVLAHPVRRRDFVVQRFVALLALVVVLAFVLFASVAVGSWLVDLEIGLGRVAAASTSVGLLTLLFGALALATGAVHPGRAVAIAVATGVAVLAWLLDGLAQAVDWLEPWRPLSPFYQALGKNPLRNGAPWGGWALLVAATLVIVVVGAIGLERRDARQ